MPASRKTTPGSDRIAPTANRIGDADPADTAELSIYLKRPASPSPQPSSFATRERLREQREPVMAPAIQRVVAFAQAQGLKVTLHDPRAGW